MEYAYQCKEREMRRLLTPFSIRDPLYGPVSLTETENEVIHSNIFERLKGIKQLGLARVYYPSANHTRFEHCIGTLYVASLMYEKILEEIELLEKMDSRIVPKRFKGRQIERTRELMRLTALLHDVGHGPFSHTLEEILRMHPNWQPLTNTIRLDSHEKFTSYLIKHDPELDKILRSRNLKLSINKLLEHRGIPLLGEIIYGDIGADRIDYLLRDTYYAGLGHRPEVYELIKHLKVIPSFNRLHLGMDDKGIGSVELLLTNRYYHYMVIAHHPVNRGAEIVFLTSLEKIIKAKKAREREIIKEVFLKYDDCKLEGFLGSKKLEFDCNLVYRLPLPEIKIPYIRFFVFVISTNHDAKKEYEKNVKVELEKLDFFKKNNLEKDNFVIDLDFYGANIPSLLIHQEEYTRVRNGITERYSVILADHSPLLFELGRSQVLGSNLSFYVRKMDRKSMKKLKNNLSKTRVYLDSVLIEKTLTKSIKNMTQHDKLPIFLYAFYKRIRSANPRHAYSRGHIKLFSFLAKHFRVFGYRKEDFIEHQALGESKFIYSPTVFNQLVALSAFEIIEFRKISTSLKRINIFFDLYYLKFTKHLSTIYALYKKICPREIRKFERLASEAITHRDLDYSAVPFYI